MSVKINRINRYGKTIYRIDMIYILSQSTRLANHSSHFNIRIVIMPENISQLHHIHFIISPLCLLVVPLEAICLAPPPVITIFCQC